MAFERIEVESSFADFAKTFRGGGTLDSFVPKLAAGILNADYYFPEDDVIGELKTLDSDAYDPDIFGARIIRSVELSGYTFADYLRWIANKEPFPKEVSLRLTGMIARPIREAIKKAQKQIASTRRILKNENALGLILIANSKNFGPSPAEIMSFAIAEFERVAERGLDAIVYFTPNVFHKIGDDPTPNELWVPVANYGGDKLQNFIDQLGTGWFDYCESFRPSSKRTTGSDLSVLLKARVTDDRPS